MISLKVVRKPKRVRKKKPKLVLLNKSDFQKIGNKTAGIIKFRVRAGLLPDGTAFPPGVDLVETGLLIESLGAHKSTRNRTIISTHAYYAGAVNARYGFMGLNDEEAVEVYAFIERLVGENIDEYEASLG